LLALPLGASFGWQAHEGCPPKRRSREGGPYSRQRELQLASQPG
jgi:hypothetical protein